MAVVRDGRTGLDPAEFDPDLPNLQLQSLRRSLDGKRSAQVSHLNERHDQFYVGVLQRIFVHEER